VEEQDPFLKPQRPGRQSRPGDTERVYTDKDAEDIYGRAAEIHAETLFQDKDAKLSETELEDSAERIGIHEKYVDQAIDERRQAQRRAEEEKRRQEAAAREAAARRATLIQRGVLVGGLFIALCGVSVWRTQAVLSGAQSKVEASRAQVDNALQRRHELVPQLIKVTKATLEQQQALTQALAAANQRAASATPAERPEAEANLETAIQRALDEVGTQSQGSPVVLRLTDEMAGAANRISVERHKYNEAVSKYNSAAGTFPANIVGSLMGYPRRYEFFQADAAARQAPAF
jgi:LemA protein